MTSIAPNLARRFRVVQRTLFFNALSLVALALLMGLPLRAQDSAGKRIALIIGNGAYENVANLDNPKNDSADLSAALMDVGFEVRLHTDLTQGAMLDTLRSFRRDADGAEIALIYFAGHGIEIDRQNYLLPVDAVLERDTDVNFEAVKLETMIFAASGADRLSMIIVDACRDNPFAASMKRSSSTRSIGRGLSAVEPTRNTLVAYAAKEGTTASDGAGRNSPYADALIESLQKPNLEVGLMMRRVRDDVLQTTGGKQEPFVYGSLSADRIYLNQTRSVLTDDAEFVETDGDLVEVPQASASEILFWKSISEKSEISDLKAYLALYPDGFFAELAYARLQQAGEVLPTRDEPLESAAGDDAVPERDLARALNRDEVVELQERLSVLGHSLGRADGIAGRRTEAAIRDYEKSEGLAISGLATLGVLTALRNDVTEADLQSWRAKQAVRVQPKKKSPARTKTTAPARTKTATRPQPAAPAAAAPEPAATAPKQTTSTQTSSKPSRKYAQFCNANKQCGTATCQVGNSGQSWRKIKGCKFCSVYMQRCR